MKPTTAQRFGSLGKSFVSPSAAAAVIGAALLASGTTDEAETAWSPSAACLLPDVLPVAGTLLSYGGSRQLAAGGTVTHSGALNLGANALTVGAITASGNVTGSQFITAGGTGSNGYKVGDWSMDLNGPSSLVWRLSGTRSMLINSTNLAVNATNFYLGNADAGSSAIRFNNTSGTLRISNNTSSIDSPLIVGALTCGAITASGAIQETPTQSALDPTTTNIPSGKRQGWYNSTLSEFRDWVNIGGTLLKSAAYT